MGQLAVRDELGTMGHGGFKYDTVLSKAKDVYCNFVPLRTLKAAEANDAFRDVCLTVECDASSSLIYCDPHASLKVVCGQLGYSRRHPPAARP